MRTLKILFAACLAGLLLAGQVLAAPIANPVPLLSGPFDPAAMQATLNALILSINSNIAGTYCVASGSTPQTCNGQRGSVTTNSLSTAGATNAAFVINNSAVTAASIVGCAEQAYSGTLVTNGYPLIMTCVPGAGTITVNITNVHTANALAGTVQIGFVVLN